MNLELIQQKLTKRDSKGNFIELDPETLTIHLRDNGTDRNIGHLIEVDGKIVYLKKEKEAEIQRNSKSWSINRNVLDVADTIQYESEAAIYSITVPDARKHGLTFKWGEQSFVDKKLYVPIRFWNIDWYEKSYHSIVDKIGYEWFSELKGYFNSADAARLFQNLRVKYDEGQVFPSKEGVFLPFRLSSFMDTRVVIVAPAVFPSSISNGLAFGADGIGSVPVPTTALFKEIERDIYQNFMLNVDYSMVDLANQGVLCINNIATCSKNSLHTGIGWEEFTIEVIKALSKGSKHVVFMFYGNTEHLQTFVDRSRHYVITNDMPHTPGYIQKKDFNICNSYLLSNCKSPINW